MITSTANTQVKELVKLMKKSRARDEAQVFLIEGPRMAGELVSDLGWRTKIEKIYLSESYAVKNERECESLEDTAAVEILNTFGSGIRSCIRDKDSAGHTCCREEKNI